MKSSVFLPHEIFDRICGKLKHNRKVFCEFITALCHIPFKRDEVGAYGCDGMGIDDRERMKASDIELEKMPLVKEIRTKVRVISLKC